MHSKFNFFCAKGCGEAQRVPLPAGKKAWFATPLQPLPGPFMFESICRCAACAPGRFHQPPPSAWNSAAVSAITVALGLHEIDRRLLISLLGVEQRQVADIAQFQLAARDGEAFGGGLLGGDGRFQGFGVGLDGGERIGHVLESGKYGAAVLRRRLVVRRLRRRVAGAAACPPGIPAGSHWPPGPRSLSPGVNSWAIAGAAVPILALRAILGSRLATATPIWALGSMQLLFRRAHVRPLLYQLGGKAHGQVLRQLQR